jgi:ABC-type transport system substrate-binding protein
MRQAWLFRSKVLVSSLIMLLAMIAVACGSSATATAVPPTATRAPAPAAAPTAAPAAAAAPASAPTLAAPAFTAPTKAAAAPVPTATKAPVAAVRGKPKVETLVISVDPAAGETNLHWNGTVDHHQQFDLVSEVLVDIDPKTNLWVPELAKSWQMSPDGKEWTLQLQKGVQWHNNWGEFTAKDVLHTAAMYQRKDAILGYARDWREIDLEKSKAVSDYEVVLSLKNPNPDYLFYLAPSGAGIMASKAQWDKGGDEAYKQDMIGTGPYRYTGRTYGVNVTYELLPNHWRRNNPPPDFQKVDLRWIKETATRNAGLLAGTIHLTELTRELADAAVANKGMKIIQSNFPGNNVAGVFQGMYPAEVGKFDPPFMYPNLPFQNIKVREAMNRAIDKETIAKTLFSGRVTLAPVNGYYPTLPGWNPDWLKNFDQKYGYDPKKARQLLAEAGYGPNNPVKVKGILMNFFGFPESQDTLQAFEVMFRDVGIEMTLEEWEFSKYFAAWTNKKPESVGIWIIPPSYKTVYAQLSVFNRSASVAHLYETAKLDELFAKLQATVDESGRDKIQREMGNILYDEYANIPLFYIFIEFVANPNIVDQWPFPGSDGANYGHFDLITACTTPKPCLD